MRIIIEVNVREPELLYEAALKRAKEDRIDPEEFGLSDGDYINDGACLQMLLDPGSLPGCEIEGSEVES